MQNIVFLKYLLNVFYVLNKLLFEKSIVNIQHFKSIMLILEFYLEKFRSKKQKPTKKLTEFERPCQKYI